MLFVRGNGILKTANGRSHDLSLTRCVIVTVLLVQTCDPAWLCSAGSRVSW
uniref:Uncharacterized protein n=1 Tax=Anguilla anguilla TaxID=7936 RepID=A0A0E9PP25_ANGAN